MPSLLRTLRSAAAAIVLASFCGGAVMGSAPTRATAAPETAAALAARAREAYEAGRFREAITLYEDAYAREANPTLLFNLGRCHEALAGAEDLARAVEKYQAYLRETPATADRAAVERRIEALREQIKVMERAAAPAPPPSAARPAATIPAETDAPPDPVSPWPWVVAGAGAGGVLAGVVLGVVAGNEHDDAVASPSGTDAMDHEARADGLGVAATVAYVAGGVLCAAGVTWGIVDVATRNGSPRAALGVGVGVTGARLVGRF